MRTKSAMIALVATAILIIGCSKEEEKPKPAPTAPPVPKSTAGAPAMPGATAGNPPSSAMPSGAAMPPAASGAAADASAAAQTQAKQLMDQAMQYIKENKLDLAEKAVNSLDAMKGQLPPDWAPKIEQVRSALNAAKATSGSGVLPTPGSK